jgi:glutamate synthase (NADPH/NADH) large chain
MSKLFHLPKRQGLYDPALEKENCGVGFIAHIKGQASHQYVLDAAEMLVAMDHRGACGCESNTGDGSGMLTALPHKFLRKVAKDDLKIDLPAAGQYAAGLIFLPKDAEERRACQQTVERIIAQQGQRCLGWRKVPTDAAAADVGPTALDAEPEILQLFVGAASGLDSEAFERQLYIIRKSASHAIRGSSALHHALQFYICSLSTKVIIYKGMLTSGQVLPYYPDLRDTDFETHLAMVHSRSGSAAAFHEPQRRNQYAARKQELDGRAATQGGQRIVW